MSMKTALKALFTCLLLFWLRPDQAARAIMAARNP
jgi:hypothetical protein